MYTLEGWKKIIIGYFKKPICKNCIYKEKLIRYKCQRLYTNCTAWCVICKKRCPDPDKRFYSLIRISDDCISFVKK